MRQKNSVQVNSVKKVALVTKQGKSFENILKSVINSVSDTNTTEDTNNSTLQGIIILSSDNLKYAFFHLGVNISELPNLQKRMVVAEISWRWIKCTKEEGTITFS